MMLHIIMTTFKSLPDKYCGQHYKNVSLDKGYQYLDEINKNGEFYWLPLP